MCLPTDVITWKRAVLRSETTHLVHAGGVFEENEAKASRSSSVGVHLDSAVRHFAKLTEVIFQVLFTRVPAEAAHKHFSVNTPLCH